MADTPHPDMILHRGRFTTLDPARPSASAVAISGGRFTHVGNDHDIMALAGPRTRVIDLRGRRVLPGLIDNHVHPFLCAILLPTEIIAPEPWLMPDGSAVMLDASQLPCITQDNPPGCGPRRNSFAVLGYPTNWGIAEQRAREFGQRMQRAERCAPSSFTPVSASWSNSKSSTSVLQPSPVWHSPQSAGKDSCGSTGPSPDHQRCSPA